MHKSFDHPFMYTCKYMINAWAWICMYTDRHREYIYIHTLYIYVPSSLIIYIYIKYMHIIYTYIYNIMHACMHYACVYVPTQGDTHTDTHTYIYMHVYIYNIHTYIYIYVYIYTFVHMYIYIIHIYIYI